MEQLFYLPMVRFLIVGVGVYGFGLGLLVVLVEKFKMSKSWANWVMLLTTLQISFLLNNFWSFEAHASTEISILAVRWVQYQIVRAIPIGLEQLGFVFLTKRLNLPYPLASLLTVATGFIFVYLISSSLIFIRK